MKIKLITSIISLSCLCACAKNATQINMTPISNAPLSSIETLDVPRYMGTWYEIAKFPNWFQRKCSGHTQAEYSLKDNGTLQVINRCQLANGNMEEAIGTAKQIGASTSAKLKVRFAPAWLSFLPMVWGDYWVIDLDQQYQLVAVSEPKKEYLWILARKPAISPEEYEKLLGRLVLMGFDIHKLEVTQQN